VSASAASILKRREVQTPCPDLLVPRQFELEPLSTRTVRLKNLGVLRATLDGYQNPVHNNLREDWDDSDVIANLKDDTNDATCLPNAGQGNCP
jgi:hypothetical protein